MLSSDDKNKMGRDQAERAEIDWRELDRRKDRSAHRGAESTHSSSQFQQQRQQYQVDRYKKQLEAFFQGGSKPTAAQEKVLKQIRQARGAALDKACTDYFQQFGVPGQWENQMLFLDGSNALFLAPVIATMEKAYAEQTASQQTLFKQRLRLLTMVVTDPTLRQTVNATLGRL